MWLQSSVMDAECRLPFLPLQPIATTPLFMSASPTNSTFRFALFLLLPALFVLAILFRNPIRALFFSGVPRDIGTVVVCIPTGSDFKGVTDTLLRAGVIDDVEGFSWLAGKMGYKKSRMRAGRFEVKAGWTNRELIYHLRGGEQHPVAVVLSNERTLENIAGKVARFLEPDSLAFLRILSDPVVQSKLGLKPETMMTLFIPNTYAMFWNATPEDFVKRMKKEHDAYWSKNNRQKLAASLKLSTQEVYTLASIVEKETNYKPERPTIAGVYLNRLRIDMKLQADPTCVFGSGDLNTRRVTNYHTTYDSPYNTYQYKGLPPGPICMASTNSIQAVLQPENHDFLYFCARADDSGTHAFAATLPGHNVNVARFREWMRSRGK